MVASIDNNSPTTPSRRQSMTMPFSSDSERVPDQRNFSDVVHHLRDVYPERKLRDISSAFCFICILHLANENHLKIEGQADLNDLIIRQA